MKLRPATQQGIAAWELPIAVARLGYGIPEEQNQLLQIIEALLASTW